MCVLIGSTDTYEYWKRDPGTFGQKCVNIGQGLYKQVHTDVLYLEYLVYSWSLHNSRHVYTYGYGNSRI